MTINKQLAHFLVSAKRSTYASAGEEGERKLADGAKEFIFKEDGYTYRDRYFGSNPFFGEELVFQRSRAIWGMNYYGHVISGRVSSHNVYKFLKTALQKVAVSRPYRGPKLHKKDNWRYVCLIRGNVDYFSGSEAIFYTKKTVYELLFHGGKIE